MMRLTQAILLHQCYVVAYPLYFLLSLQDPEFNKKLEETKAKQTNTAEEERVVEEKRSEEEREQEEDKEEKELPTPSTAAVAASPTSSPASSPASSPGRPNGHMIKEPIVRLQKIPASTLSSLLGGVTDSEEEEEEDTKPQRRGAKRRSKRQQRSNRAHYGAYYLETDDSTPADITPASSRTSSRKSSMEAPEAPAIPVRRPRGHCAGRWRGVHRPARPQARVR